ncbi:hypothetical protein C4K39_1524 [Pseudomonas sessilinigenes]|nr:hypothetical protein C4K39_1524 [Pseudomonas sessilinigenes]
MLMQPVDPVPVGSICTGGQLQQRELRLDGQRLGMPIAVMRKPDQQGALF